MRSILTNEKYKGDALLQKCYTVDFLTKKQKKNEGEIPQYYVVGNHEPIIEPSVFDLVQQEIAHDHANQRHRGGVRVFSGKIVCGQCGGIFGSKVWHSNDPYCRVIWQCNQKYGSRRHRDTPHLTDKEIESLFLRAFNKLLASRDEIRENYELIKGKLFRTEDLEQQRDQLSTEEELAAEMIAQSIRENAATAMNQENFNRRYTALCERHEAIKKQLDETRASIAERKEKQAMIDRFVNELMKQPAMLETFDPCLWSSTVETVTVYSKKDVRFRFRNGMEIQA